MVLTKYLETKIPQIIPLSSFYVGMGPALKCCLYTHWEWLEKVNFSLVGGCQLEIDSGLQMGTCVYVVSQSWGEGGCGSSFHPLVLMHPSTVFVNSSLSVQLSAGGLVSLTASSTQALPIFLPRLSQSSLSLEGRHLGLRVSRSPTLHIVLFLIQTFLNLLV